MSILQEIGAVEDTPDDLVFDLLTATAWPDQPIGRPILGTREGVEAFDRAAIDDYLGPPLQRRRHRRRRRRRGRARSYPGPCSISASKGSLPRRRRPRSKPPIAAARPRSDGASSRPMSWWASRAGGPTRPDHDAAQVFAAAVGGGMSSRLFQEVREKRGPRLFDLWIPLGFHRHRPVRLLRRLGRPGCGGGGRRLARLPCGSRARA